MVRRTEGVVVVMDGERVAIAVINVLFYIVKDDHLVECIYAVSRV